jgi:hypothetical protein
MLQECLTRAASLTFLFAIGLAAVIAICTRVSETRITIVVAVGIFAFFAGGMHDGPSACAWVAALSGVFFPALEAAAVRLGRTVPRCATWSYAGYEGIPPWLVPLWACAGLFVLSVHGAIQCALEASGCRLLARPILAPFAAIGNPVVLVCATALAAGAFFAMMASGAHPALIFAYLATLTATAWVAMGMSASLFLTAAIVGIGFPVLEAVCCWCGAWRYDPDQPMFLSIPGIPVWLVPLWTAIVLLMIQVSNVVPTQKSPP